MGVPVSIRAKTGEIISTKICPIPVKALAVSKSYTSYWNSKVDRTPAITDMLIKTQKATNGKSTISCDNARQPVSIAKKFFNNVQVHNSKEKNKKIDLTFLKMRQDISRLRRKTLATTKKRENLQKHLDLYVDYHNEKRVA